MALDIARTVVPTLTSARLMGEVLTLAISIEMVGDTSLEPFSVLGWKTALPLVWNRQLTARFTITMIG